MFYKILLDGMVVDVIDGKNFVKYQNSNDMKLLTNNEDEAFGILSSDMSTIWHLEGLLDPPENGGFSTVAAVEISEDEAKALREQLGDGEPVENPEEPEPEDPGTEEPEEPVMTPTEMRQRITELTATVEDLTQHNEMLEECLLELSEIVYA
ncbi:MAG: hypothetical protein IJ680_03510 [Paludibacteraceae bacterium]|nr:hypothetical protein [Eubacterium sp.]MBR1630900.1 hypothetical protein [Paludibacteraceae bacterium]